MDGSSLSMDSNRKAVTYQQARDPSGNPWFILQPIRLCTLTVAACVFILEVVDAQSLS